MQIYLLFAERKSDALQLKILIYRPKGTVCKGFRRKDRRFSYLQGEICGGRVLRASAGEGSARTAPWRRSVAAGVAGFDRPAGRSGRIAKIADEVTSSARAPGAGVQNSGVFCARSASAGVVTRYFSLCLIFWCFWIKPKAQEKLRKGRTSRSILREKSRVFDGASAARSPFPIFRKAERWALCAAIVCVISRTCNLRP